MNEPKNEMPRWALPIISWLVAVYFLFGVITKVKFPPSIPANPEDCLLLFLFLFFLFFPFIKSIKIGKLLEIEREIEQTKDQLSEFRTEVRNNLSLLSTTINTVTTSNQLTVNFPGQAELAKEKEKLDQNASPNQRKEAEEIRERIISSSEQDNVIALIKLRIELERELRRILDKSYRTEVDALKAAKFMGVQSLFRLAIEKYPQLQGLEEAFRQVNQICNAAAHGRPIPSDQEITSLFLGSQILVALKSLDGDNGQEPALV